MWKWIVGAIAALSLPSACFAAFAIFQTYSTPTAPQIFYNIVTDGGAICQDNHVVVTRVVTINSGSPALNTSSDTFASGDVGKAIFVPGAAGLGGVLRTTIAGFTDARNVTLALNANNTVSGVSTALTFGTDDAPKFAAFNTWARANQGSSNQVVLTIPSGRNCWFGTGQTIAGTTTLNAFASGINNLIVEGAGATINSIEGSGFQLGGTGTCFIGLAGPNGCSARIQSVSAGSSQVTLTSSSFSAGYLSRFAVGKWAMVGGLDPQALYGSGGYGDPVNLHFFEWRQITAINTGTGAITLDRPLTNTLLDTWPEYNDGDPFHSDSAGPATIWVMHDSWNMIVEYRGLTISQDSQTYAQGRNITYRDVTFTGGHGGIPTQNETWSAINCAMASMNMETDKLVGTMYMDNTDVGQVKFQSSSTDVLIWKNSSTNFLDGTPKRAELTDMNFTSLKLGAYAYGFSTPGVVVCTRCNVGTFIFDAGFSQAGHLSEYSMSGGVISFPNTSASGPDPASRWAVPGAKVFWSGGNMITIGAFTVVGVTQDATNTYVQTNEAGGFPAVAGNLNYRTSIVPQFTCNDCTGDPRLVATSVQSGATPGAPLATYGKRNYAPTSAQGDLGDVKVRGKIVSLSINVTQAYNGAGSATVQTGQFHLFAMKQSDWTSFDWVPSINLKVAGERVITPSGTTCNGVPGPCAGDTCIQPAGSGCFNLPEAVWIQDGIGLWMGSTLGAGTQPLIALTARTDQVVVP